MISMIRTKAVRVLAASLVAAVALTVSASEAKALDAHVTVENQGHQSVNVYIDGSLRARAYSHNQACFTVYNCHANYFTITVRSNCGHVLLSRHVDVCHPGQHFTFYVR